MTLSFGRPGLTARALTPVVALTLACPIAAPPVAAAQQDELAAFTPALAELPPRERALATLYARGAEGRSLLRRGSGVFICLGDVPGDERFSATCHHRALDPLSALGERLQGEGLRGDAFDTAFEEELEAGRVRVPSGAYEVIVSGALDAESGAPAGLTVYHLVYTPGATPAEVGLPDERPDRGPYLHHAGHQDAHVMWSEVRSSS